MKHRITAALERFSRAMLAPLSYLSAAGLLLVVGALLTSAPLAGVLPFLRWEPVQLAGRIIYKCLTAVISNLSVLFCTGLAAALAKREKHQAAFIALMSYLVYLTAGNVTLTELGLLAQPDALTGLYSAGQTMVLGIQTVDTGVFGGILLGLLTAFVYDRTCEKAHRGILGGVFSGVRWSFACVAALAAVLGSGACFVWPPIQKAIAAVTGLHCRFRQYRVVFVRLSGTAAHPYRAASSGVYAVPVLAAGRSAYGGQRHLYRCLCGHDDRI